MNWDGSFYFGLTYLKLFNYFIQKLGTVSATTKFTQGSTSDQLAVKIQAKTVKYGYMKNTQK